MNNWTTLVVLLLFIQLQNVFSEEQTRPHIVYILVDDLGWNDVGFTGRSDLQTPNIDALAYHGRILMQHYSLSICSPSRAALLTGKYAVRTGMQGYPLRPTDQRHLPLDQRLLPQYLKDLGYQTHLVGKWHQGHSKKKYTPTKRGFDSHFGYYNGYIGYCNHSVDFDNHTYHDLWRNAVPVNDSEGRYATDLFTEEAVKIIQNAASPNKKISFRKPRFSTWTDNKDWLEKLKTEKDKILNKLDEKIEEKLESRSGKPLFLLLSHLAVHGGEPRDKECRYHVEDLPRFSYIPDEERRQYAAMVWRLDKSIGRVVEALEKNGILNNTIIVLTSDNGAVTIPPAHNGGSNHPLRGLKFVYFEGGIRTVALIWTPKLHTKQLGASRQLFHITDWLPTLYEAAGGDVADLSGVDGRSQWQTLFENEPSEFAVRSEFLVNIDEELDLQAVRYRQWKLLNGTILNGTRDLYYEDYKNATIPRQYNTKEILGSKVAHVLKSLGQETLNTSRIFQIRAQATVSCNNSNTNKIPCDATKSACLFNLELDPCETNNLLTVEPEVTAALTAKLETYVQLLKPQLPGNLSAEQFPPPFDNDWAMWPITSAAARTLITGLVPSLLMITNLM